MKENGLDKYIKDEIVEPKEHEAKEKHEQDLIKAMRIIFESIKDHLIPQVSYKKKPNQMYDALSRMYERRNINRKMNLRAQLKATKMRKGKSIQDYFTRVSLFKEQIDVIGDSLDEDELIMTSLNGLTRPWYSLIHTLCARKESMKFDIVWEDYIQEEDRLANKEALLKEDDQALATHTRRRIQSNFKKDSHKEYIPPKKFQRNREINQNKYYSKYQCHSCHKIGHLTRECTLDNKKKKIHHAHLSKDEYE